jgi:hypothetical protein
MFRLFSVAFMVFPFFGLWKEGILSGFWFVMTTIAILLVCLVQTATRSDRTPIYEIVTRMVLTAYLPFLVFWWVVGIEVDMTFWEVTWYSFFGVAILVAIGYVVVMTGMAALGMSGAASATGHHAYWDSLPAMWNPHSITAGPSQHSRSAPTPAAPSRPSRPAPAPSVPSPPFPTIPVKRK